MTSNSVLPWVGLAGVLLALAWVWNGLKRSQRRQLIRHYRFPNGLFAELRQRHPQLDGRACSLVAQALRQFFLAYLLGGRQPVAMPSKVVDDLWHAFILNTRQYDAFCRQAFGRFLHHTPAATMGQGRELNTGLRRIWWHLCKEENIDPRAPRRIPLLFAIDRKLGIAGGHYYQLPQLAAAGAAHAREQAQAVDSSGGGDAGSDAEALWSVEIFCDREVDGSTDGFPDAGGGDSSCDGGDGGGGGCGGD